VRTSNITKIKVFINKLLNIIFGAKIYGVIGGRTEEGCTMKNFMDSAVFLVSVRQLI
jgi:hypothetical protein